MKKVLGLFVLVAVSAAAFVPASVRGKKLEGKFEQSKQVINAPLAFERAYVPGEVIVQFKPGTSAAEKEKARKLAHASRKERLSINGTDEGMTKESLEVDSVGLGLGVDAAMRAFMKHPAVAFAEPNWIYTRQDYSNDERYVNGSLWGMESATSAPANAYGSQAANAWANGYTGSRNVIVAVIDEGVDYRHTELAANFWTNPYEIVNGVDDDGNGYVDDIRGWDFANNDNSVYDGKFGDNQTDDHGTHVAGTIGAVGGNGVGVVGVNWQVTIISAKFMGSKGGTTANAVRALDYVTNLKRLHPGMNIVATSNSWGGGSSSQALHDAIVRAAKQNILFVVAAGNAGLNLDKRTRNFPAGEDTTVGSSTESAAGYDAVIVVAAIDSSGRLASFSSYGMQNVDIAAPGVNIYSTAPNNNYLLLSGTSMATPHVTGAVALYASVHLGAMPWAIKSAVLSSAVWTPSLQGLLRTNGRLDVNGALSR